MALTEDEKADRARQRMIDKARELIPNTYLRKTVSPIFQRMIRAEFAAIRKPFAQAIVKGQLRDVRRDVGQCVCVTCGKVTEWDAGIKHMHTGHFIASRRNSILLEEDNVAPQCSSCNYYQSGVQHHFRLWMEAMRGPEVIERLEKLKTQSVKFTHEQLVDLRIQYQARLKAAQATMKNPWAV